MTGHLTLEGSWGAFSPTYLGVSYILDAVHGLMADLPLSIARREPAVVILPENTFGFVQQLKDGNRRATVKAVPEKVSPDHRSFSLRYFLDEEETAVARFQVESASQIACQLTFTNGSAQQRQYRLNLGASIADPRRKVRLKTGLRRWWIAARDYANIEGYQKAFGLGCRQCLSRVSITPGSKMETSRFETTPPPPPLRGPFAQVCEALRHVLLFNINYPFSLFGGPSPYPEGYWNGGIWPVMQWFLWRGLLETGEPALARRIADTILRTWQNSWEEEHYLGEHFMIQKRKMNGAPNFGGLNAVLLPMNAAYYTPGHLTTSYDVVVHHRTVECEAEKISLKISAPHLSSDFHHLLVNIGSGDVRYRLLRNGEPCGESISDENGHLSWHLPRPQGVETLIIQRAKAI